MLSQAQHVPFCNFCFERAALGSIWNKKLTILRIINSHEVHNGVSRIQQLSHDFLTLT